MQNRGIFHSIGMSYEGSREQGFGEHLVKIYGNPRRPVKPYNAGGGTPLKQVKDTHKYPKFNGCEKVYIIHDSDRKETEQALEKAKEYGYETILAQRTLEEELLRILPGVTSNQLKDATKSAEDAKRVFADVCKLASLNAPVDWETYFPKELLDEARKTSPWLGQWIRAIEG